MRSWCHATRKHDDDDESSVAAGTQLTVRTDDKDQLTGVGFPRRSDEMNYLPAVSVVY